MVGIGAENTDRLIGLLFFTNAKNTTPVTKVAPTSVKKMNCTFFIPS
jgi:hypothetical protein